MADADAFGAVVAQLFLAVVLAVDAAAVDQVVAGVVAVVCLHQGRQLPRLVDAASLA